MSSNKYDAEFSKTEGMLYSYYRDIDYIEKLKTLKQKRINEIKELTYDINNNDGVNGIDNSRDAIQTSYESSVTERCVIKNMTDSELKIGTLKEEIHEINKRITDTEDKNRNIKDIIELFKGEDNEKRRFIELKYKPIDDTRDKCRSLEEVAGILGYSYRQMRRKREAIINEIMRFLFLEKADIA